jgi:hypothetical protein
VGCRLRHSDTVNLALYRCNQGVTISAYLQLMQMHLLIFRRRWLVMRGSCLRSVFVLGRVSYSLVRGVRKTLSTRLCKVACFGSLPSLKLNFELNFGLNPRNCSKKRFYINDLGAFASKVRRAYTKCSLFHPSALGTHLMWHCVSMKVFSAFSRS